MQHNAFSRDHKHIPMTKTTYAKKGSKWEKTAEERSLVSMNQAELILASAGLPFERSHRREKKDRFGHCYQYDTFTSISPDGTSKTKWFVDFAAGRE